MSRISPSRLTRRGFAFGAASAVTLTAACGNGVGSNGSVTIDARVDATLDEMYRSYPNTADIADKASGMLVMPLVTEAGFGFGAGYGRGALRVGGATVDYYSNTKASAGLQIGAAQYAHVLFFMTNEALENFRRAPGWTLGADVGYVINDRGESVEADSNTLLNPILAAVFGQAGLKVGATLEGSKYSRIIP